MPTHKRYVKKGKSRRKIGKMQKNGKSKKGKGKTSSRVKKTRRRRGQAGSGWTGKRLDELRDAAKKATASISVDTLDPIEQDNEIFDITNIPESIKRFNTYLGLKKHGRRYRLQAVEISKCHKKLRGYYTAPACINLKFRTKVGPYVSEMDRQIGPLNDFKDGHRLNLPFIVLFNKMQIRPDGFDVTTVEKQFHDGVPEHQILQSSFIADHKFPREPIDPRTFLAQKEDDLETLKQRAASDRASQEGRERARQVAEEQRQKAEREEIERQKAQFAKLHAEVEADRKAEEEKAKAEAEAKAKAEAEAKADAERQARQEAEFRKTAEKVGRFAVGKYN